ncbi:MAG: thiamine diphosphokinase [Gemmobacter sp.]
MNQPIVDARAGVTLVAGGPVTGRDLGMALARAPVLVAADGGADRALALGAVPVAVIGDFDSIGPAARARLAGVCHEVAEQETTDFDKALRSIRAPFVIALGVLGGRVDHELAALSALAGQAMPVVALGREDVVFAAPADLTLRLRAGDRLSLYPLGPVTGQSRGLDWPIDGLVLSPQGRLGTSNRVTAGTVTLAFDAPGTLVILPRARLDAALRALSPAAPRGGGRPAARGG